MFFLNNPLEITAYTSFLFVWAVHLFSVCHRNALIQQQQQNDKEHADPYPDKEKNSAGISVVVLTHNQEKQLPSFLKSILSQDYDSFEIVIVDKSSTDNTHIILEEIKKRYEQVQCTFVPQGTRQLSSHTLALTLGVKAARYPWVLVITPDFCPASDKWLARMATQMTAEKDFVLGARSTHSRSSSLRSFHYLTEQNSFLSWTLRHHAYHGNEVNLAFRKECLLSCKNLGEYGKLLSGIENIIVNRFSKKGRTAVCVHPEALLLETREPADDWQNELLYLKETEHFYLHRKRYRFRRSMQSLLNWLLFLLSAVTLALSIITHRWEYTAAIGVLLIIWAGLRIRDQKKKARLFQIKSAGLYFPFYELRLWFLYQATSIRYAFEDKKIFYRKMLP